MLPDAPPPADPPTDDGALLTDPRQTDADLRLIERALDARWEVRPQTQKLLPDRLTRIALNLGPDNKPGSGSYAIREQLRAAQALIKMQEANAAAAAKAAQIGLGGTGGTTLNQQINIHSAEPPGASWICDTLDEVAAFFGRSRETIKDWRAKGMPGEAGGPGRPGRYDLREILAWRDTHVGSSGRNDQTATASRAEAQRVREWADARRAEHRLAVEQGAYIEADLALRLVARSDTHAVALFQQVPDRALQLLPADATPDDRREFRAAMQRLVDDVIDAQGEALRELLREIEDEPEGDFASGQSLRDSEDGEDS